MQLLLAETKPHVESAVLFGERRVEELRIVGVDAEWDSPLEVRPGRVRSHVGYHARSKVGDHTELQRDLVLGQIVNQSRVFDGAGNDRSFVFSQRNDDDPTGIQDRADAHRQCAAGYILGAEKIAGGIAACDRVQRN